LDTDLKSTQMQKYLRNDTVFTRHQFSVLPMLDGVNCETDCTATIILF